MNDHFELLEFTDFGVMTMTGEDQEFLRLRREILRLLARAVRALDGAADESEGKGGTQQLRPM